MLKLRDELSELRRSAERQQRRLVDAVVAVLCGVILLAGGGWWAYQHLDTSVQQGAVVNTEKIRAHLLETVEETHRRELADAEKATDWQQRQRLRDAVEAAHATRLAKIDELAASFAEIEGRGLATSVLQEMTRVLTSQGVDEAITYVASQRTAILQTVRARVAVARERNRADLQPLLRAAALHENKGQPTQARALYADVLSAEPDWPDALHDYIRFLVNQGDDASVRTTQVDARRDYDEARRLALHLTALDPGNTEWQRDLSVSFERLGDVAVAQGRLDEAGRTYGDGLAIRKKLTASDPGNTEWQRDLWVSYNKLGDVAVAQGKLDEAARAYGDGLDIRKKLAAGDPGNTQWQRDLSVSYNKLGDVAVAQGRLDEAARAYGDGLAIHKKLTAGDPGNTQWQRDLSYFLFQISKLQAQQKRWPDAIANAEASLKTDERLSQLDHSNVTWQQDVKASQAWLEQLHRQAAPTR
ncbi:MAG: tetratricopeptide repeat protein [Comamonadaceae bacterium]|nr:tetratricopeptide repeat protein [Comamonadaceae bacterium]